MNRILRVLTLGVLAPMLLGYLQAIHFFGLMTHFRLHLSVVALLLLLPAALLKDRWSLSFCGLTLLLGAVTLVPYYIAPKAEPAPTTFRLYTANILGVNRNYEAIARSIREADADVVALMEVEDHHALMLDQLEYPFKLAEPHPNDFFGMALFSRLPVRNHEIFGDEGVPNMRIEVEVGESTVQVVVTHPYPPVSDGADQFGRKTLEQVAQTVKDKPRVVVTGDLNATGWGRRVDILKNIGLREARKGFGYQATWPAGRPLLYIPIDHVYTSPDLAVKDFKVLPAIGSDHFPVLTQIGVFP